MISDMKTRVIFLIAVALTACVFAAGCETGGGKVRNPVDTGDLRNQFSIGGTVYGIEGAGQSLYAPYEMMLLSFSGTDHSNVDFGEFAPNGDRAIEPGLYDIERDGPMTQSWCTPATGGDPMSDLGTIVSGQLFIDRRVTNYTVAFSGKTEGGVVVKLYYEGALGYDVMRPGNGTSTISIDGFDFSRYAHVSIGAGVNGTGVHFELTDANRLTLMGSVRIRHDLPELPSGTFTATEWDGEGGDMTFSASFALTNQLGEELNTYASTGSSGDGVGPESAVVPAGGTMELTRTGTGMDERYTITFRNVVMRDETARAVMIYLTGTYTGQVGYFTE